MAPFDSLIHPGTLTYFLTFLLIGMGFGAVLEMSGFGDSRKLAAQFYFKDMTVLKVMFTAIIVAAVLIFLSSSLGWLNYDRIWVNPTYLGSEILGGLIMGVGFIIGGFCPGTSLAAAATLKLDGIFFVLGGLFGVWAFGETMGSFEDFYNSSFYGRLTLFDWLGLPAGVMVLLVVLMALMMFYGAEMGEAYFKKNSPSDRLTWRLQSRGKIAAATLLLAACGLLIFWGQPSPLAKWERLKGAWTKNLNSRDVYVHPGEVVELKKNPTMYVQILDVRPEADFNLFHIGGAQRLAPSDIGSAPTRNLLLSAPDNTVFFLVSNGEVASTKAWQELKAIGILNLYIIEGGINKWLEVFPPEYCVAAKRNEPSENEKEALLYQFYYAVGAQSRAAHPDSIRTQPWVVCPSSGTRISDSSEMARLAESPESSKISYVKKVKLQRKVAAKGGCG